MASMQVQNFITQCSPAYISYDVIALSMVALIFAAKNITPWYIMHMFLAGLIIYQWPRDEGSVVLLSSLASSNKKFKYYE